MDFQRSRESVELLGLDGLDVLGTDVQGLGIALQGPSAAGELQRPQRLRVVHGAHGGQQPQQLPAAQRLLQQPRQLAAPIGDEAFIPGRKEARKRCGRLQRPALAC